MAFATRLSSDELDCDVIVAAGRRPHGLPLRRRLMRHLYRLCRHSEGLTSPASCSLGPDVLSAVDFFWRLGLRRSFDGGFPSIAISVPSAESDSFAGLVGWVGWR